MSFIYLFTKSKHKKVIKYSKITTQTIITTEYYNNLKK